MAVVPKFGAESLRKLRTCDERLQKIMLEVVESFDCTVLEGHRGEEAQNRAFAEGKSKLKWPNGNHNRYPSNAVDVAPFPVDWNDLKRFYFLAGLVFGIARKHGVKIRWGGSWQGRLSEEVAHPPKFLDLPHFEVLD